MLRLVNDILQAKGLILRTGTAVDATLISASRSIKAPVASATRR
jgi:IS5 family transposase